MLHHVFVYGTLKSGEPNFSVLTNEATGTHRRIDSATTITSFPLVIASKYNIPFLLDKPGFGHRVTGEVYEVDDRKLAALDELETHPDFYVELHSGGRRMEAWIYFLPVWRKELEEEEHHIDYRSNGPHGRPYISRVHRVDISYDLIAHTKGPRLQ